MSRYKLWMSQRKNPDDIFMMLGLQKAGKNLLSSPLFTTFTKFTDAYHAKNLGITMTTNWIRRSCQVRKVLENEWRLYYSKTGFSLRMTPSSLKLDQIKPSKLFKNPMFAYWLKSMDDFHKSFPGKIVPRTVLSSIYKDEDLVKAITAAQKNQKTKDLANKLETEVLKQFIFAIKDPVAVAKLFHVKEKTDANWKLWKKYVEDYNK
uniref:RxLR effector PexRD54 WY domain-containing protein n=1 Tax=Phytophthora ramorum TaxID=164328 RepID=H3H644_PHYRM